ncbi:DUF2442 domain-containing protein [Desulfoluna sp.]|uniref:DUF2442 domain-containing protein n=1 Tax=Desulfoluna sp. TaxID=2045199 RepID=UPI00260E3970|nr:DUF2442 domain-containing protein [Desulfoluna sp.]
MRHGHDEPVNNQSNTLGNYTLSLRFDNGEERFFDVKPYLTLGRFSQLKEKSLFEAVKVSFDTIEWPGELDFDPQFLYEKSEPALEEAGGSEE